MTNFPSSDYCLQSITTACRVGYCGWRWFQWMCMWAPVHNVKMWKEISLFLLLLESWRFSVLKYLQLYVFLRLKELISPLLIPSYIPRLIKNRNARYKTHHDVIKTPYMFLIFLFFIFLLYELLLTRRMNLLNIPVKIHIVIYYD